jgi:hypothetical protein
MAHNRSAHELGDDDKQARQRSGQIAPGRRTLTMQLATAPRRGTGMPSGARELDLGGGEVVQLKSTGIDGGIDALGFPTSGGAPLAAPVRHDMERSLGADFSGVRVHEGPHAPALGALAFATGNDLHFAPGRFDTSSTDGRSLLGHELAHVVQQREGRVAAPGQGKGLPINDDDGLEREADAWGAAAARGEIARQGAFIASDGGRGPVQRKTEVGLVKDVAPTSMTIEVLQQVLVQNGVEKFFELLQKLMTWGADAGLAAAIEKVGELLLNTGVREAIEYLVSWITPLVGWLKLVRPILGLIPDAAQTLVGYGLGRGMHALLGGLVGQAWADSTVNAIFVGNRLIAIIPWILSTLDDIIHHPASFLYRQVWQRLRGQTPSVSPSTPVEAQGAQGQVVAPDGPAEVAPVRREPEVVAAPLVKKDLKYLWLEVDAPALARFDHKDKPSGGLQLPFKLGLNLFGTTLDTKKAQLIQVPWSGGFTVRLADIEVANVPKLPPVFSVGTIKLPSVIIEDSGLAAFSAEINDVSFGEGAVTLPKVTATWKRGAGLAFTGSVAATVLGTPIVGSGKLALDGSGGFESGSLTLGSPASFEIIPGVLTLANPEVHGGVAKGGAINMGLSGDVHSKFGIFQLDVLGAHVDYQQGKGSAFSGGVRDLTLKVGKHVTLNAKSAVLDRTGLEVAEASLLYVHDPEAPDRAKDELTTLGGIDPSILNFTGLKSLVVGGIVHGLKIKAGQVAVQSASLERGPSVAPLLPSAERGAPVDVGPAQPTPPTVHADRIEPVLSKIGASLFGIDATLDIANKTGSISGAASYKPSIPSLDFAFPVLPGLEVFASLGATAEVGGQIGAQLTMREDDRFHLSGNLGATGKLGAEVTAGAQVGSQLAAAIAVGLYAKAEAVATVTATASGVAVLDRKAKRVRGSTEAGEQPKFKYTADAELTASLGVKVNAKALVFFNKELWRYELGKWVLGSYHVAGEIASTPEGGAHVGAPAGAFAGDGKPKGPAVEAAKIADAQAELRKPQPIFGSADARKAYLAELVVKYKAADEPAARELDHRALEVAEARRAYFARNEQLARTTPVLSVEQLQERAQEREKMEVADAKLAKAKADYREIQLVLVNAKLASDDVLTRGEVDIASIEQRIRDAAEAEDRVAAEHAEVIKSL